MVFNFFVPFDLLSHVFSPPRLNELFVCRQLHLLILETTWHALFCSLAVYSLRLLHFAPKARKEELLKLNPEFPLEAHDH